MSNKNQKKIKNQLSQLSLAELNKQIKEKGMIPNNKNGGKKQLVDQLYNALYNNKFDNVNNNNIINKDNNNNKNNIDENQNNKKNNNNNNNNKNINKDNDKKLEKKMKNLNLEDDDGFPIIPIFATVENNKLKLVMPGSNGKNRVGIFDLPSDDSDYGEYLDSDYDGSYGEYDDSDNYDSDFEDSDNEDSDNEDSDEY